MSYNRRLFCCNGYSGKALFIGRTTMKKISAILFSIILAVIMTVTNMAGTYHSALRVYAAEINEDAQEQENAGMPAPTAETPALQESTPGVTQVPGAGAVPETVTVTFDANGHGTAPTAAWVEKGQAVAKPDDPAADGFTFTGWYTDAYATALWDFNAPVLEAIVLYAGWQENAPHTHTFGEWVTTQEATETETGSKERVCSVCGYTETEEIQVIQNKAPRLRNGDPTPIHVPVETGITLIDDGANAKRVYYDGEPLDLTGLSLLVDWDDGSQTTYQVKAENVHGFDSSKMGPQTLRITYGISFHVYFDIEVKPLATTPTLTPPTITRQGNTVLISSPSPGTIGYTLDGKDPVYWNKPQNRWNFNGSAAWESYTVPFELGYGTTTVKAAVRAGDGSNASTVTTAVFERSLPRVRVFDQNNGTEYLHNNMTAYNSDNATIRLEGEADTIICYRWFGDPVSYDSASGSYKLADDASLYTGPFKNINSGNSRLAVRQMLPDGSHVSEQTIIFFDNGYESPSGQASVTVTVSPYGTGCEIRADADGVDSQEFAQGVFKVDNGRRVTLTAKPKTGYRFLAWVSNGTVISTNDSMGLKAEGNLSIQAHFTATNSTGFTVSWNGGSAYSIKGGSSGNYRVSGTENVAAGGSFAFSVNPHSGYRKTDSFRVLAGNTPLSLNAQGNYVINPVYQDTKITVEGLEQEPGQTYETKVIAGTGGYARVNGVESVTTPGGTKVTLTAFPDEGYRFLYWTSLPSYVTEAETKTNPLVYTVNQNATVIRPVFGRVEQTYLVSASGDGHGQVTASPAAGTEGTEVTLRVTPDRGWRVKDWTVVEGGVTVEKLTANTARLTIGSDDISVQANFEPVPGFVYDVTVTATPTGWGTVSASHSSGTAGTEVTLTATPDMLMQFARWEVIKGGVTLSDATTATATFTIGTSDVEIRAVFEDTPITVATSVTVTTDGNGQASANPSGNMSRGTQVTLSATPNPGYRFKEWESTTITGEDASNPVTLSDQTDPNATFYANATRIQIKAHFEQVYSITDVTVSFDANGGGGTMTTETVASGDTFLLPVCGFTAPAGKQFKAWKIGSTEYQPGGQITITADTIITAVWEDIPVTPVKRFDIKVSATPTNGGTVQGGGTLNENASVTITATPNAGYQFKEWRENGTAVSGAGASYTFTVTKDRTLEAVFEPVPSTERRVDVRDFSDADIPQSLKNAGYDTTAKIQNALLQAVINKNGSAYGNSYALYEVVLMVSFDGGITWVVATPENFPTGGITVTLPYPTGTGRTTHNFSVAHMFTVAMRGHLPGQTETPPVTKTDNGIRVTLDGLSPVLMSWTEVTENTAVGNNDMPIAIQTGATTTRTTTEQQERGVRMSQTGDDLYERLGIHTMLFIAALWLVLCMSGRNVRKTEGGGYASDEKQNEFSPLGSINK